MVITNNQRAMSKRRLGYDQDVISSLDSPHVTPAADGRNVGRGGARKKLLYSRAVVVSPTVHSIGSNGDEEDLTRSMHDSPDRLPVLADCMIEVLLQKMMVKNWELKKAMEALKRVQKQMEVYIKTLEEENKSLKMKAAIEDDFENLFPEVVRVGLRKKQKLTPLPGAATRP